MAKSLRTNCGHSIDKCEHGVVVAQCGCKTLYEKAIRFVPCDDECRIGVLEADVETLTGLLIMAVKSHVSCQALAPKEVWEWYLDHKEPS